MNEFIKVLFHLTHGKTVTAVWDGEARAGLGDDDSVEALEAEINEALAGKPKWFQFGDTWVFTGAVSAIELDF